MLNIFAGLFATLITIPFIGFILVYLFSIMVIKSKKKSFFVSVDITTFFLIISVHYLLLIIIGKSLFWLILLVLLISIGLFTIVNWKMTQVLDTAKIFKGFWRFTFLLFFVVYFVLFITGMVQRIILVG